jgi:thioredoxin 1
MNDQPQDLPTLFDFYADWCGPCKAMNPTIEALTKKYEGKLEIKKVNVDDQPELAKFYNVRSIPTLILVAPDEKMRVVGGTSAAVLESKIEEALKSIAG